tara:strand:- start:140 stop:484 length:345 start_codon:yes stop_codon:yes gene_type:complete
MAPTTKIEMANNMISSSTSEASNANDPSLADSKKINPSKLLQAEEDVIDEADAEDALMAQLEAENAADDSKKGPVKDTVAPTLLRAGAAQVRDFTNKPPHTCCTTLTHTTFGSS